MEGKSASLILRRINPQCKSRAESFFYEETLRWLENMCLTEDAAADDGNSEDIDASLTPTQVLERRQRADALATAITLLGAVRRVEGAEKLGLDMSDGCAASVWCVLDDILSFCERMNIVPIARPDTEQCTQVSSGHDASEQLPGESATIPSSRQGKPRAGRKRKLQVNEDTGQVAKVPRGNKEGIEASASNVYHARETSRANHSQNHTTVHGDRRIQTPSKIENSKRLSRRMDKHTTPSIQSSTTSPDKSAVGSSGPNTSSPPVPRKRSQSVAKRKERSIPRTLSLLCLDCMTALDNGIGEDPHCSWHCQGGCFRTFHRRCRHPAIESAAVGTICRQCADCSHTCFLCGRPDASGCGLVACRQKGCGRFYHRQCLLRNPRCKDATSFGRGFRCPLHWCDVCGLAGSAATMVSCVKCCTAYHNKCRPKEAKILSKKYIVCAEHSHH